MQQRERRKDPAIRKKHNQAERQRRRDAAVALSYENDDLARALARASRAIAEAQRALSCTGTHSHLALAVNTLTEYLRTHSLSVEHYLPVDNEMTLPSRTTTLMQFVLSNDVYCPHETGFTHADFVELADDVDVYIRATTKLGGERQRRARRRFYIEPHAQLFIFLCVCRQAVDMMTAALLFGEAASTIYDVCVRVLNALYRYYSDLDASAARLSDLAKRKAARRKGAVLFVSKEEVAEQRDKHATFYAHGLEDGDTVTDGSLFQVVGRSLTALSTWSRRRKGYYVNKLIMVMLNGVCVAESDAAPDPSDQRMWLTQTWRDALIAIGAGTVADRGFYLNKVEHTNTLGGGRPHKTTDVRGSDQQLCGGVGRKYVRRLSRTEKLENRKLSRHRAVVENFIGALKRWKIAAQRNQYYNPDESGKDVGRFNMNKLLSVLVHLTNRHIARRPLRKDDWAGPNANDDVVFKCARSS